MLSEQIIIFIQIVLIDLVLAGDNAIIIGMVASQFPPEQRKKIIFWGISGAVVLRIILTLLTALSISAVAIYYSILGLAAIFAGAAIPIMVMGSVLEVGKLVTASWLYQNWKVAPRFIKAYLSIAVVVLMFITSMGIFGFLSKAHVEQTSLGTIGTEKLATIEEKLLRSENRIERWTIDIDVGQLISMPMLLVHGSVFCRSRHSVLLL